MYAATPATARTTIAVDTRIARSTPPPRRLAGGEATPCPGGGQGSERLPVSDSRCSRLESDEERRSVCDMLFLQEDEEEPGSSWLPYPGPRTAGMVTRWRC